MILLFAILIPVLTAGILLLFFSRKMLWWEFLIPFVVSVILVFSFKAGIEHTSIQSEEYWGSFVQRVEYYEKWDEWVTQQCSKQVCTGSGKNRTCRTKHYDCSHKVTHDPYWVLRNTIGEELRISQGEYNRIKRILGNESETEMHRHYYHIDGDMFHSDWRGDSLSAIPVTTLHNYENRVKAADASIFKFADLHPDDIKRFDLKEYPRITDGYKMDYVLGDSGRDAVAANKKIKYINGRLGHDKEVCVFVLVFKNQPLDASFKQEAYWKGANMNEFVVCVGIDDERNVDWCRVISWTHNEDLKLEVRDMVADQKKLRLSAFADQLEPALATFQRRDFKEFNYLTVEPSWGAIILTYVVVILANIGVSWWAVRNEHHEDAPSRFRY